MAGNPFGLSEISHFGSFQRVGGKAGGFINKKFFHPSSIRNQEKLWKAQSADERERKKQNELDKRREEEKHVEEMRKQLYLAGQGKASDLFVSSRLEDEKQEAADSEQKAALREQKLRMALVKSAAAAAAKDDSDDEDAPSLADGARALARSRYKEDKLESGHSAIWGSWYSSEDHRWGFGCCKAMERKTACPMAPEEPEKKEVQEEKTSRKRKKGNGEIDDSAAASGSAKAPRESGGLQNAPAPAAAGGDDEPLIDMRMLEAAKRRRQEKQEEKQKQDEVKRSGYLNKLLNQPGAEPPA